MSEPFSEEILSAYLDGELSADAMARVEKWLATSDEARAQLRDLQLVSRWMRELPGESLPAEFASEVMHRAERRMLLPGATVPLSRRLKRWSLIVGAPLATAAMLFVVVQLSRPDKANEPVPQGARRAIPPAGVAARAPSRRPADDQADSLPLLAESTAVPAAVESMLAPESGSDSSADARDAAPAKKIARGAAGSPSSDVDPAAVEQVVAGIRQITAQGKVPVLRLYVVDRSSGLEMVQLLLDAHDIPREQPAARPEPGFAPPRAEGEPAGRQAVFVVADVDKLTAALEVLLGRQNDVFEWSSEAPVDLAALDPQSKVRVAQALRDLTASSVSTSDSPRAAAERASAGAAAKSAPPADAASASVARNRGSTRDRSAAGNAARRMRADPHVAGGIGLGNVQSGAIQVYQQAREADARQMRVALEARAAEGKSGETGEVLGVATGDSGEISLVQVIIEVDDGPRPAAGRAAPASPAPRPRPPQG